MKELIKYSFRKTAKIYAGALGGLLQSFINDANLYSLFSVSYWVVVLLCIITLIVGLIGFPFGFCRDAFYYYILWAIRSDSRNIEYVKSHENLKPIQIRAVGFIRQKLVEKTVKRLNRRGIEIKNPLLGYDLK